MKTEILKIDPLHFSDEELLPAAEIIRRGGLVIFPTETVYGLGANALDGAASSRIFDAKGRPHDNPLIVHVQKPADFSRYCECDRFPLFSILSDRFMPGPLTVITPKKLIIPDEVTVGLDTVAIRCPVHPVANALIRLAGVPVAAPSANLSGKPSPTCARHVLDDMMGRVDMIIDGGEADVGLESTVVSLKDDEIHLLRPGFITYEDLKEITEKVIVSDAVLSALPKDARPESPGMKYRHYAPRAPVTMVEGGEEAVRAFFREKLLSGAGILCFDEDLYALKGLGFDENVISFGKKTDLNAQAHRLFGALRLFDERGVSHVFARFTARDHLGLAISNRLLRACAFDILKI